MAQGRISIIMLFIVLTIPLLAQHDQGGFIKPGDSLNTILPIDHMIYLPFDGLSFYEFPSGPFKGKILPGPPLGIEIEPGDTLMVATITGVSIRPQLLTKESFFSTINDSYYLSFDQQKDNYVLVFGNSFHGWVAQEEILSKGFILVTWLDFYGNSKGQMIHSINKIAAIYQNPNADSKIIENAEELYSEIETMGKCVGNYCFVKVIQYRNPYDPSKPKEDNVLRKYKGWIQIIDEEGRSLVAFNSQ